jgi:hypothetical protein
MFYIAALAATLTALLAAGVGEWGVVAVCVRVRATTTAPVAAGTGLTTQAESA